MSLQYLEAEQQKDKQTNKQKPPTKQYRGSSTQTPQWLPAHVTQHSTHNNNNNKNKQKNHHQYTIWMTIK